jgi:DNA-binding MarR family transcriptional regulator
MTGERQGPWPPLPPDPIMMLPSRLAVELAKTARRLMTQLHPDDPLRFPRVLVLATLAHQGPLSQREVSEAIDMDPGDLVALVDALEELGFLTRERDPRDRRRYSLEITEAGRVALHERRNFAVRMNDQLFAGLLPAERSTLEDLLRKALAHHDPRFGGAPHPAGPGPYEGRPGPVGQHHQPGPGPCEGEPGPIRHVGR